MRSMFSNGFVLVAVLASAPVFAETPDGLIMKGVAIEVKASTARLTGTVYSTWDQLNAIRIARFASGVKGVENQVVARAGIAAYLQAPKPAS